MCGILGVLNLDTYARAPSRLRDYIEQGAIVDSLRGADSTGLFQVNDKGLWEYYKLPVCGEYFVMNKTVKSKISATDRSRVTVVHNRAATRGEVSSDNAHPFGHELPEGKSIVGVHNGTLSQSYHKYDGKDFDVDSDYLIYRILKEGGKAALSDVYGSYALAWYQKPEGHFSIATNGDRSIFWAFLKGANIMLFASESGMIHWLASRNNLDLEDQMVKPEANVIYSWELDEKFDVRKPKTEKAERKTFTPVSHIPTVRRETDSTARTGGTTTYPHNKLAPRLHEIGFSVDESVPFVLTGDPSLDQRWVEGLVEDKNGNTFAAKMFDVNPTLVQNLINCDYAMCKPSHTIKINDEVAICVNRPLYIVSGDKTPKEGSFSKAKTTFEDMHDLPDVPQGTIWVQGPDSRLISVDRFNKLTEDGCARCTGVVNAKFASQVVWVQGGAICHECAPEYLEHAA